MKESNLMTERTASVDIDSLAAAIIQLEIQNISLQKSNGSIQVASLQERLKRLQEENDQLVLNNPIDGNILEQQPPSLEIPKASDSKNFNLVAPEKVKKNRNEEIAKSARRLKKLVAEMQQNIQPLAPSSKFDEVHLQEYQYFLNPQSIRSVASDSTRAKRGGSVGNADADASQLPPETTPNAVIAPSFSNGSSAIEAISGRVSDSDYKAADTARSEMSFSGHFAAIDMNSSELPPSFSGSITGSFEFCVVEADFRVLLPSEGANLRRSPMPLRSTAQSSQIQGYNMYVSHKGSNRILSTYFPSRTTYGYPRTLAAPSIENISDFCFPSGVSVNVCGVASANCFTDSSNDKFHVMQFTNSFGHISYACCLTIRTAVQLPDDPETSEQILLLSVQQKAARIIMKVLRHFAMISKRNKWQSYSQKVSKPKFSPAPPLSRPTSLTSPERSSIADSPSSHSKSFFSKYFGASSSSTQKKTLVTDLTTMYNEIVTIMNDDGEDISLQKLVELSTTLKKARDAGCTADVFPVLAKCDALLNSYGVGLEPVNKATNRNSFPAGSSGITASAAAAARTERFSDSGYDSQSEGRRSFSASSSLRTDVLAEGGLSDVKKAASHEKLRVVTDSIDPVSPASDDDNSSSDSEGSYHMAAFKDYYKTVPDSEHKLPWPHMMEPKGKVIIAHQAYCVVTSSPHHALFYHMLMEIANADRRASSAIRESVEPWTVIRDRTEKRHRLLEQVHRVIEAQPELFLEPLIDSSGEEPLLTKSTMLLSVPTASPRIGRRKVSLLAGADIATPRSPSVSGKASKVPPPMRLLRSASSNASVSSPLVCVPGYVDRLLFDPYKYPTTQEWTTAVLFSCLSSAQIFKICNLLLMEKSLVIVGEDVGIVTALAFAVSALLTPFQWQGVFIPLVPNMVREIFDAPVPFIVGSTAAPLAGEVSSSAAVLVIQKTVPVSSSTNLTRTLSMTRKSSNARRKSFADMQRDKLRQEALATGIVGFSGWFTRLPEVNADVPIEGELTEAVNRACKFFQFEYIFDRRRSKFSSTHAAQSRVAGSENQLSTLASEYVHEKQINIMLMNHMSTAEVRLVNSVLELVSCHNLRFTGDLCDYTAWPRYVRSNSASGDEEFLPELFMEPIKRLLEFHEAVVQTQMFVGFVDRIRVEQKSLDPFRLFLRDWIFFRLYLRGLVRSARQSNDRQAFTG